MSLVRQHHAHINVSNQKPIVDLIEKVMLGLMKTIGYTILSFPLRRAAGRPFPL